MEEEETIMRTCKSRLDEFERPCPHRTPELSWLATCLSAGRAVHNSLLWGGCIVKFVDHVFLLCIESKAKMNGVLLVVQFLWQRRYVTKLLKTTVASS